MLNTQGKGMAELWQNFWLVVEDDDNDFFLFRRACTQAFNSAEPIIHRAKDGLVARVLLQTITPNLIVSDLKMPCSTGLQLVEWMRCQNNLKNLRFVMLTSSDLEEDRKSASQLGVDDYRVKPAEYRNLVKMIREIAAGQTFLNLSPCSTGNKVSRIA